MEEGQFGMQNPEAWAAHFQQGANRRLQDQNAQVEAAKQQMIDNVSRMSVSLRAAADSCDQFILAVTRSNATVVATALSSNAASTSSVNDRDVFRRFVEANEHMLGASAGAGGSVAAAQGNGQGDDVNGADTTSKELSKRAKKLAKKAQDPDAPKRPPSAYLLFQNEVRADMKNRYPDLPYKEMLNKVSEAWKRLTDDQKKVYQDKTTQEMERWAEEKKEHERRTPHPTSTPTPRGPDESNVSATLPTSTGFSSTPSRGGGGDTASPPRTPAAEVGNDSTISKSSKKRKDGESKKDKKAKKEKREKH